MTEKPATTRGATLIPFGQLVSGDWVTCEEVPRGRGTAFCPECRGELVARQGKVKIWHFAHWGKREHWAGSAHCGEGSLHRFAKHFLADSVGKVLHVPIYTPKGYPVSVFHRDKGPNGADLVLFRLQRIRLEHRHPTLGRRFDAVVKVQVETQKPPKRIRGRFWMIVEICVSNPKDAAYRQQVRALNMPVLEIQLSVKDAVDMAQSGHGGFRGAIKRLVLGPYNPNRHWLIAPASLDRGAAGAA